MGGGLMQLVAYGAQDVLPNGQSTNYILESYIQTLIRWNLLNRLSMAKLISVECNITIGRNGDLAFRTYYR